MNPGKKTYRLGDPNLGVYNQTVGQLKEKDIREYNFNNIFYFAKLIKTMFGPKGLNKLLLDASNNIIITQKGSTVVSYLRKKSPIVQFLTNLVETQEKLYGDGTKTILLLTAFLLEKAKRLLNKGIAPQIINEGLSIAKNKALEVLEDNTIKIDLTSKLFLENLIDTILMNKISVFDKKIFINHVINLSSYFKEIEYSDILYRKVHGKSIKESQLINGMIIYKDKPNYKMPTKIENPVIILIKRNLDFFLRDNININRNIEINEVGEYNKFLNFSPDFYRKIAKELSNIGVNVIFCEKKMNPIFIEYCTSSGIIALELVGEEDIKNLSKLLGVQTISDIKNIEDEEKAKAEWIEFKKIANDEMLILTLKNAKVFTFLLRGGTEHILNEIEETLKSSVRVAMQTVRDSKVLPGGGALEIEIAHKLKEFSETFPNKLQFAIYEIAKAFENIPGYLIKNSGQDPLDLVTKLRKMHIEGQKYSGFDANSNTLLNVVEKGIFDSYQGKKYLIKNAIDAARQIIRVDRMLMVTDKELLKEIEDQKTKVRSQRHEERLRKYFKEKEEDLFNP